MFWKPVILAGAYVDGDRFSSSIRKCGIVVIKEGKILLRNVCGKVTLAL